MERRTILFDSGRTEDITIRDILTNVYNSLEEREYNAVDQMVGYLLSGDPSYITSHNNARNLISKVDREDLAEEILREYLGK